MTNRIKWSDTAPERKGALLLARHEGKVIEFWDGNCWVETKHPQWSDCIAFRVKPEPVVEEVKVMVYCKGRHVSVESGLLDPTHRITFNLVDGKPDCDSIKMEKIND